MLLLGVLSGATCATCATVGNFDSQRVMGGGGEKVGVVEMVGPITDGGQVVRQLRDFGRRDELVAVILRIDSPGGAVAPSQEIYNAMREVAKKKPVVASMGNVAASGGFWVSLGADWVFALPGSITGSIGVITQTPDLRGVADALRFSMRTFTSGPLKDAGNPFREMTDADRALFESLIADIYGQFVGLIVERRGLSMAEVKKLADGRIFTGRAALQADLIDELGGLHEAAKKAVLLAEARSGKDEGKTVDTSSAAYAKVDEPRLVYPPAPSPSLRQLLLESVSQGLSQGLAQGLNDTVTRAPVELR